MQNGVGRVGAWLASCIILLASSARADDKLSLDWLKEDKIPHRKVSETLNGIERLSRDEAFSLTKEIKAAEDEASRLGKRAATLLLAVAHERTGQAANPTYEELIKKYPKTRFAWTATYRIKLKKAAKNPEELEEAYEAIEEETAGEKDLRRGWFRVNKKWRWTDARKMALEALIEIRKSTLSFRFFRFIWDHSYFPRPYEYLFILLVVLAFVKVLEIPLAIKAVKTFIKLARIRPQMESIRSLYAGDTETLNQKTMELYKTHGVNPFGGCALFIVDIIFVIWLLVSFSSFTPVLELSGTKFFWIDDVTAYDTAMLLIFGGWSIFQGVVAARNTAATTGTGSGIGSHLIGGLGFMGLAWYMEWPAYVLLFWISLGFIGQIMQWFLRWIYKDRV